MEVTVEQALEDIEEAKKGIPNAENLATKDYVNTQISTATTNMATTTYVSTQI